MIDTLKIEYAISAAAAKEPEVGDIFVFASKNNNVYLEWIVVRYHPDNHNSILLAPVDDFFLKGTPDLDLSLYMKRRYIVRCGQTDWFPKNMCQDIPNKSAKVGKISGIVLTLIRNRISDLARGISHIDDINKDDDDANYEEYMEEVASVREQLLENKQWQKATMFEAITHASNHTPESKTKRPEGLDFDFDEVSFTDGTAIACRSEIHFSFNESSDHTVSSPIWMIYK